MEVENTSIDFNLCLVCQTEKDGPFVENPRYSYEKYGTEQLALE